MIVLDHVTKTYILNGTRKTVANDISAVFPTGSSVALIGRNGAGKSSMLRMIAGTMLPSSGRILSTGSISWPVGYGGSFHPELTGEQNVRFLARVYGIDSDEMVDFVADFAKLGQHLKLPFRSYSSGMRARLAFGASMAVPFDTYLVDEVTSVGDAAFRQRSNELFLDRLQQGSAVVVAHSMPLLRTICNCGAVLEHGKLTLYDDVEEAIDHHLANMKRDS